MYADLKNFVSRLTKGDREGIHYDATDIRLSIAILYYRVILADGQVRRQETQHFRQIVSDNLNIGEDELMAFESHVHKLANDQTSLTKLLAGIKKMPIDKRREILLHMEEISRCDHELHEVELNLVATTAELIGLGDKWKRPKLRK